MKISKLSLYAAAILTVGGITGATAGCIDTPSGPKCHGAGQVCFAECCSGYMCQYTPGTDPPSGTCVAAIVPTAPPARP